MFAKLANYMLMIGSYGSFFTLSAWETCSKIQVSDGHRIRRAFR